MTDVRTGTRFPVKLAVKVAGNQGERDEQLGTTKNMSAAGIYLLVDRALEVGSTMEFEVTVPAELVNAPADVRLHCSGRVIRNEVAPEGNKTGVACVIDTYEFVRRTQQEGEEGC